LRFRVGPQGNAKAAAPVYGVANVALVPFTTMLAGSGGFGSIFEIGVAVRGFVGVMVGF
jgi:hypothetical protein